MKENNNFIFSSNLIYQILRLSFAVLILMNLARVYLFYTYGSSSAYTSSELFNAFFLGIRLDLSILAYVNSIPILLLFIIWLFKLNIVYDYLYKYFRIYFLIIFIFLSMLIFADLAYFSYFAEHATLMIFGLIDDDTQALVVTAFNNYNVTLFLGLGLVYLYLLHKVVYSLIIEKRVFHLNWNRVGQGSFFIGLILVVILLGRGSLGKFPLAKTIPDVSADRFINQLAQNAGFSMIKAYKHYKKSKSDNYDLIKVSGYKGNITEAFRVHTNNSIIDEKKLINNITYITKNNQTLKEKPPHVVLIMVESFGMPLLDYQSESFNIMGQLKKHFDEDILFTNFISTANGTVVSLEPTLLNITARPNSASFAQSTYLNTSFKQASAKVYQDAGYETSFIYSGDLSWRNQGDFMSRQGFSNITGRAAIAKNLERDVDEIAREYGIFDGYAYQYIQEKLQKATTPQFIFLLTVNNHPPYTIPKDYKSNSLVMPQSLKEQITGDIELAKIRLKDYAYALDMAGNFLSNIKNSKLSENTVIAITADNNTIEGIINYDDYYTQAKKIPFYLYLPQYIKPQDIDTTLASSHKDIFPTLYNLSLSSQPYISVGTSLLQKDKLHCGFNDAGVIMTKNGGFKYSKAISKEEKKCEKYYKATLAVTEYLIKSHQSQHNNKSN